MIRISLILAAMVLVCSSVLAAPPSPSAVTRTDLTHMQLALADLTVKSCKDITVEEQHVKVRVYNIGKSSSVADSTIQLNWDGKIAYANIPSIPAGNWKIVTITAAAAQAKNLATEVNYNGKTKEPTASNNNNLSCAQALCSHASEVK